MLTHLKLESAKFWTETEKLRCDTIRRERRKHSNQRLLSFVAFTGCASILAVAFALGAFENVDVLGTVERIGKLFGLTS